MKLVFTILGCGSSGGVPRCDGNWGACDPTEPRNRRLRCSALIERVGDKGRTTALIDTSPDMRTQLLSANVKRLDAVIFTHDHADHTHGLDDLRIYALNSKARVPVYMDQATGDSLRNRFEYCFRAKGGYPAILESRVIKPMEPFRITGPGGPIEILPFPQFHGDIISLGLRIGALAYSPDVSGIPEEALPVLEGLDVWILDALRPLPHHSHFSVDQATEWIGRVGARRGILTHLHIDCDYQTLRRDLPAHVEPAHDGLVISYEA